MSKNIIISIIYSIAATLTAVTALIFIIKANVGMFAVWIGITSIWASLAYVYYSKDKKESANNKKRFIMKKDGLDIAVDESLGAEDQRDAEKLEELENAEMNQRLHFYKMKEQRAQILAKEKGLYRGEVQVNEKTRSNVFSEKENELQGLAKAKGLYHDDREAENENILGR